jgi:hypothetical protein
VKADVLTSLDGWDFMADGKQLFEAYLGTLKSAKDPQPVKPRTVRD